MKTNSCMKLIKKKIGGTRGICEESMGKPRYN
jgi:hypothetical protein